MKRDQKKVGDYGFISYLSFKGRISASQIRFTRSLSLTGFRIVRALLLLVPKRNIMCIKLEYSIEILMKNEQKGGINYAQS